MATSSAQKKRVAALRRRRGRILGAEGPKVGRARISRQSAAIRRNDSQRRSQGAKANRQAKAEYIRKTPKGDGARLKPKSSPPRRYITSGKKR